MSKCLQHPPPPDNPWAEFPAPPTPPRMITPFSTAASLAYFYSHAKFQTSRIILRNRKHVSPVISGKLEQRAPRGGGEGGGGGGPKTLAENTLAGPTLKSWDLIFKFTIGLSERVEVAMMGGVRRWKISTTVTDPPPLQK